MMTNWFPSEELELALEKAGFIDGCREVLFVANCPLSAVELICRDDGLLVLMVMNVNQGRKAFRVMLRLLESMGTEGVVLLMRDESSPEPVVKTG